MARKLNFDNGTLTENRSVECPSCGILVLKSELDDHECS